MTWAREVLGCSSCLARQREWLSLAPQFSVPTCIRGQPLPPGLSINQCHGGAYEGDAHLWDDNGREPDLAPGDERQPRAWATETGWEPHVRGEGQEMPACHSVGGTIQVKRSPPCVKNTVTDTDAAGRATFSAGTSDPLRTSKAGALSPFLSNK